MAFFKVDDPGASKLGGLQKEAHVILKGPHPAESPMFVVTCLHHDPLVMSYRAVENRNLFHGKIHYFHGDFP